MNGNFILDTNILIALFAKEQKVVEEIGKAKQASIPSIVIGELYYGAYNSGRTKENVEKIDRFKKQVSILFCDDETARLYGQIKKQLKDSGTPIPENDIWIAALSFQYDQPLVTRDQHFGKVKGLKTVAW